MAVLWTCSSSSASLLFGELSTKSRWLPPAHEGRPQSSGVDQHRGATPVWGEPVGQLRGAAQPGVPALSPGKGRPRRCWLRHCPASGRGCSAPAPTLREVMSLWRKTRPYRPAGQVRSDAALPEVRGGGAGGAAALRDPPGNGCEPRVRWSRTEGRGGKGDFTALLRPANGWVRQSGLSAARIALPLGPSAAPRPSRAAGRCAASANGREKLGCALPACPRCGNGCGARVPLCGSWQRGSSQARGGRTRGAVRLYAGPLRMGSCCGSDVSVFLCLAVTALHWGIGTSAAAFRAEGCGRSSGSHLQCLG